jgi:hypothetical protein
MDKKQEPVALAQVFKSTSNSTVKCPVTNKEIVVQKIKFMEFK